ncbi:MAG: glutamate ABC transporter substrate-binding protein [Dehalococcoidia bacterium]
MKRAAWLFLVAGTLATAALLAACGDDDTSEGEAGAPTFAAGSAMARIASAGELTVGVKSDQPGFGLREANGSYDGFDVAMGRAIGRALGLGEEQVRFVEVTSANRIGMLTEGKVDLVIATMTITEARRQEIDFSRVYFRAGQSVLVQKANTSIRAVGDLNGRKACSVTGSTSATTVRERAPQVDLLTLDTYGACVTALKDGRVEAVTTDDVILAGYAKADATLKLVGGTFTEEPYGIGVRKGQPELVAFVDGVIESMLEEGRWEGLYTEYLGGVEGVKPATEARAAVEAGG